MLGWVRGGQAGNANSYFDKLSRLCSGLRRRRLLLGSVLGILALYHFFSPLKVAVVVGGSMLPSLPNGGLYLLDRTAYQQQQVEPGDVVVLTRHGRRYIKRVIAVGGQTLYLTKQRNADDYQLVPADQIEVARQVASHPRWRGSMKLVRWELPPDTCFVLGDNFSGSVDSRSFGPVLIESIEGRVLGAPVLHPEKDWVCAQPRPAASS